MGTLYRWSNTSRHQRGYGWAWVQRRAAVLRRDAYLCRCAHCTEEGRIRSATEVDHVVPRERAKALGWTDEQIDSESNLQAINADCHRRKTQEDEGKSYRRPDRIGIDGFPVETV